MRILMWTPLPPERSGIADYSYELLESLRHIADVTAVSPHADRVRVPDGVGLVGEDAVADELDAVNIYQMGNNTEFHRWIYERAMRVPGLVVLHDTSMLDFALSYFGGIDSADFQREMRFAHGPIWGERDDPSLLYGWPAVDVDGVKHVDRLAMTMERRIVSANLGVVVHDPYRARLLQERYPGTPVATVASGAPVLACEERGLAMRRRFGWDDEHVVFGVFGGFTRIKRILVTVSAFAQVRLRQPHVRLLIAGHPREPEIADEVDALVDELGVRDSVVLTPSPPLSEFQDMILATDAVIGLRWPTAGETSAVMMRAFGAGRVFITTDLPQHRHFDRTFCRLVPIDPVREGVELIAELRRLALDPEAARTAGDTAREYVRTTANWPTIAAGYVAAAETAVTPGRHHPPPTAHRPGVNLFADVRSVGAGTHQVCAQARALAAAEVNLTFTEFSTRKPDRSLPVPRVLGDLGRGKDHPFDLWMVDFADFDLVPRHCVDRYTIGCWSTDQLEFDRTELARFDRVDEVWVPSSFVAELFRTVTSKPVRVIPPALGQTQLNPRDSAGELVVTTCFDVRTEAMDNPQGAVAAFREAFPNGGARLVVGIRGNAPDPADIPRFLLRDDIEVVHLDARHDSESALLGGCDLYLSLHRTTAFGMTLAHAMAAGIPAVATGYGGNMDYMSDSSAAIVGYRMSRTDDAHRTSSPELVRPLPPGPVWADPDITQAARWLRGLADNRSLRRAVGSAGSDSVARRCSPQVVGAAMAQRLWELRERLPSGTEI